LEDAGHDQAVNNQSQLGASTVVKLVIRVLNVFILGRSIYVESLEFTPQR